MLFTIKQARKWNVEAADGNIGSCTDFLFSSRDWGVRYLVADKGNVQPDRRLLISTIWLRRASLPDQRLEVEGTKHLIETRLKEYASCRNGLRMLSRKRAPSHGSTLLLWGGLNNPAFLPNPTQYKVEHQALPVAKDLRSAEQLVGYTVLDGDDPVGPLDDIVLDDRDWAIRYAVVNSRNCAQGRKFLVSPQCFADIQWEARRIRLDPWNSRGTPMTHYGSEASVPCRSALLSMEGEG